GLSTGGMVSSLYGETSRFEGVAFVLCESLGPVPAPAPHARNAIVKLRFILWRSLFPGMHPWVGPPDADGLGLRLQYRHPEFSDRGIFVYVEACRDFDISVHGDSVAVGAMGGAAGGSGGSGLQCGTATQGEKAFPDPAERKLMG